MEQAVKVDEKKVEEVNCLLAEVLQLLQRLRDKL